MGAIRRIWILSYSLPLFCAAPLHAEDIKPDTSNKDKPVPNDVIIVTGQRDKPSDMATESLIGRMDMSLLDTPLVVQRIHHVDLENMAATDLYRAVRNISAVTRRPSYFGQNTSTFTVRGFELDIYTHYLKDGFRYLAEGNQLMNNIDSVEVLKGAAAIIYGMPTPGGIVNIVSKRPSARLSREIVVRHGRWQNRQAELAQSGPINADATWMYRVDVGVQDNESFRDTIWNKTLFVAPQLMWVPDAQTQLRLRVDWTQDHRRPDYGVPVFGHMPANVPISRYYGEDFDLQKSTNLNALVSYETSLSDIWQLRVAYGHYAARYSSDTEQLYNDYVKGNLLYRSYARYPRLHRFDNVQLEGAAQFARGVWAHHLLMGVDLEYRTEKSQPLLTYGRTSLSTDIFHPTYIHDRNALLKMVRSYNERMDFAIFWGYAYVQDQIDINDTWHVLVAVRAMPGAFTPRAGISYKVTPHVSLFTSYARMAKPNYGSCDHLCPDYPHEQSSQIEAGAKFATQDGRVNASFAVFDMSKKNVLLLDAFRDGDDVFEYRHQSRGVEMDISADLPKGLRLVASYAYVDAQARKQAHGAAFPLANTARHGGSIWLSRDMILSARDVLNLGVGIETRGLRWINASQNMFMPGYVVADMSANWQHRRWSLSVLGNNIFNKRYYEASAGDSGAAIYPGRPRYWQMKIGYKY